MEENNKELLQRMTKLFEQRDAEFKQRKQEQHRMHEKLLVMAKDLKESQAELEQREVQLKEREKMITEQNLHVQEQAQKLVAQENDLQQKYLAYQMEVEDLRNRLVRFERLEEQEQFIQILDLPNVQESASADAEITAELTALREENTQLQSQLSHLEGALERSRREKAELLKQMLQRPDPEEVVSPIPGADVETEGPAAEESIREISAQEMVASGTDKMESEELEKDETKDETKEDLTAEILERLLPEQGFEEITLRHSDLADQVLAQRKTLSYRFVFDAPPYFDVLAKRKENRSLHKVLESLSKEHPELVFGYENGYARATGYFTSDVPLAKLMNQVERVSSLFETD